MFRLGLGVGVRVRVRVKVRVRVRVRVIDHAHKAFDGSRLAGRRFRMQT